MNREKDLILSIIYKIKYFVFISSPESYKILYTNTSFQYRCKKGIGEKYYYMAQGLSKPCSFYNNKPSFIGSYDMCFFRGNYNKFKNRFIDFALYLFNNSLRMLKENMNVKYLLKHKNLKNPVINIKEILCT